MTSNTEKCRHRKPPKEIEAYRLKLSRHPSYNPRRDDDDQQLNKFPYKRTEEREAPPNDPLERRSKIIFLRFPSPAFGF